MKTRLMKVPPDTKSEVLRQSFHSGILVHLSCSVVLHKLGKTEYVETNFFEQTKFYLGINGWHCKEQVYWSLVRGENLPNLNKSSKSGAFYLSPTLAAEKESNMVTEAPTVRGQRRQFTNPKERQTFSISRSFNIVFSFFLRMSPTMSVMERQNMEQSVLLGPSPGFQQTTSLR